MGRAVRGDIPPLTLNLARWSVASVVLVVLAGRRTWRARAALWRHRRWLLLMTVSGVVVFHALVYTGLTLTPAVNATTMMGTAPIVIPVVAYLMKGDRVGVRDVVAIVLSVAGVLWIMSRGDPGRIAGLSFAGGDLIIVGAVAVWGVYSVALRDRPAEVRPVVFLTAMSLFGSLLLVPVAAVEWALGADVHLDVPVLAAIGYVGLFASVVAYLAWNRGVASLGAVRAGPYLNLMPVFGALLALVFLGERLEAHHLVGAAAIAAALVIAGVRRDGPAGRRPAGIRR